MPAAKIYYPSSQFKIASQPEPVMAGHFEGDRWFSENVQKTDPNGHPIWRVQALQTTDDGMLMIELRFPCDGYPKFGVFDEVKIDEAYVYASYIDCLIVDDARSAS